MAKVGILCDVMAVYTVVVLVISPLVRSREPHQMEEVPIGTMFQNTSRALDTALRLAIDEANRHTDGFQVARIENWTDGKDSFLVSNAICSQLSRGVYAIIGLTNSSSASTILSYAEASSLPFITTSMSRNLTKAPEFLIQMRPEYTEALLHMIKYYKWEHVYYIYTSDEGMLRLQQLFKIMNRDDTYTIDIDPRRVVDPLMGYYVLKDIYRNRVDGEMMRVVLDMSTSEAQLIISTTVADTNISRQHFHYLLTDLGIRELNVSRINVTGLHIVNETNVKTQTFIKQWQTLNPEQWPGAGSESIQYEQALVIDSVNLVIRAIKRYLEDNSYEYGIFSSNLGADYAQISGSMKKCTGVSIHKKAYGRLLMQYMKKIYFDGITGRVDIDENGYRTNFTLQIIEINSNGASAKIGQWRQSGPPSIYKPALLFRRTNGSADYIREIVTILSEPYVKLKKSDKDGVPLTGNDRFEGYCVSLAKMVSLKVPFEYRIHIVKDKTYGAFNEKNKSWNGIIGELVNDEAHIAIADLTITAIRERAVDFTKPFMSLGIAIMIKQPVEASPGVFSFMDPLSYEIWMCILFAYTGVSVVLFLVSRFSPSEWYVEDDSNVNNDFSISNSFWFALGAFMQQGCEISPRSVSGRIAGCVWWFFTLIIISSYTANLAAFLTVERMSMPIESVEDLVKQTEVKYGTLAAGATTEFFKTSEVATYRRMNAYMTAQPSVYVKSQEEGIRRVREGKGKYAVLLESTTIDYYQHKAPCDTMRVGSDLDSKGFGIATPIGSEDRDKLTLAVLMLRESGELTKMRNTWWNKSNGSCVTKLDKREGAAQSSLNVKNVAGIFFILIGGLILAVVTALSEFVYKSRIDSRRTKTTFGSALRSKARLSFRGHSDDGPSTYRYSAPTQMIGMDGYNETNTHTQV